MSVKLNTAYNIAGGLIPTVAAIFAVPYLLEHLGNEKFGVLAIIWALIGYVNLFDLGVSRSLTYEVSKLNRSDRREVSDTILAGSTIAAGTGAIGAAIICFGSEVFTTRWLNIGVSIRDDVFVSLVIISFAIVPVAINTAIRGALEGLDRFASANLNRSIVGTMMFLLPVLAIEFSDASLAAASLYLLAGRVILAFVSIGQVWKELTGAEYRHRPRQGSLFADIADKIRRLLRYGIWIAITGVVGPLMTSGDRFVIVKFVNAGLMPAYIIPQEGLQKLLLLPASLFGALFPRMSGNWDDDVLKLFWKYYKMTAVGMAVICAAAAVMSYPILKWWISEEFAAQAYPISIVLCLGIWINSLSQAPYTLLHARGRPKITAIFHLIELVLYFALLIILLNLFGLIGAAYAWVLRVTLDLILLHFAALRVLKEGVIAERPIQEVTE